jgi:L-fuconolactonase
VSPDIAAPVVSGSPDPVIDAHHHFWRYDPTAYPWIDDSMSVLKRDWLPADLACEIGRAGVDAVISVQARQTIDETRWLVSLAAAHEFIVGVVGWVPLASPSVRADLVSLTAAGRTLRGVRHVVQEEPDPTFLERPDFNAGIAALREFGLAYDILIVDRQIPAAIAFVDRHPGQVFVLDHAAKPRIRDGALDPWRAQVGELARRPQVYCKLSGLVTEAAPARWTDADLRPYLDATLEAFGPDRILFGSDWPVCLLASTYRKWVESVRRFVAELTPTERAQILGGTARRAYRL